MALTVSSFYEKNFRVRSQSLSRRNSNIDQNPRSSCNRPFFYGEPFGHSTPIYHVDTKLLKTGADECLLIKNSIPLLELPKATENSLFTSQRRQQKRQGSKHRLLNDSLQLESYRNCSNRITERRSITAHTFDGSINNSTLVDHSLVIVNSEQKLDENESHSSDNSANTNYRGFAKINQSFLRKNIKDLSQAKESNLSSHTKNLFPVLANSHILEKTKGIVQQSFADLKDEKIAEYNSQRRSRTPLSEKVAFRDSLINVHQSNNNLTLEELFKSKAYWINRRALYNGAENSFLKNKLTNMTSLKETSANSQLVDTSLCNEVTKNMEKTMNSGWYQTLNAQSFENDIQNIHITDSSLSPLNGESQSNKKNPEIKTNFRRYTSFIPSSNQHILHISRLSAMKNENSSIDKENKSCAEPKSPYSSNVKRLSVKSNSKQKELYNKHSTRIKTHNHFNKGLAAEIFMADLQNSALNGWETNSPTKSRLNFELHI